jgi:Uma2 family endonuclease
MTARRTPHRFTVAEYDRMIDQGILKEDARVELIRGEIVAKMPVGDPHVACVNRLNRLLVLAVGEQAIVSIQNPIRLADSEPEPDVVLIRPGIHGKPGPADILLVIEVADASLEDDREVKRPLYAENGIAEFWIVNLIDRCLEVHRQPRADGLYADVPTLRAGETIEIGTLPAVKVAVADVIGQ